MNTYYYPRDYKVLEMLHASMMEEIYVEQKSWYGGYTGKKVLCSIYKWEFDGFEYRVVYPGEFEFIQRIHRGKVVPETVQEFVYSKCRSLAIIN